MRFYLIIFRADRLRTSFPKHSCPTYFSHFRKMYMVLLDTLKSRKIFISRHVILTSMKKKTIPIDRYMRLLNTAR